MKRVLIASGKGGVGRTSLAANLAASLARRGESVLALDLDQATPALDLAFGEAAGKGWGDILTGEADLESAVLAPRNNLALLAYKSGGLAQPDRAAMQAEEILNRLEGEAYEWLLIDAPAGPQPCVLKAAERVDLVLHVLTPEPASLAAAYVLARSLEGDAPWAVVVNEADSAKHAQEVARRFGKVCAQFLSRTAPLAGYVRRDERVKAASREMRLWDAVEPPSACVKDVREMAASLADHVPASEAAESDERLAA